MVQHSNSRRDWGAVIPGVIMIAVGAIFLLERFDVISMREAGRLWPIIIIGLGLNRLLRPGDGCRSIFLLLLGIWLQINTLELFGLDWGDSWPLLIIFVGASFVFDALVGGKRRGHIGARVVIDTEPLPGGVDEQ
jgi:uncharacterized integral membrane protein